ncbi:MAG: single-stranded DNA-binding protein [Puniceicoccales bacterium]|jgi:single-strand DNA-binding protein|nr:single-stranded DNA-binding protein [Puniceicoccales bacterium]
MASFNKVILMGNLTRDPEVRITQHGVTICKFAIAVSRQSKALDGTSRDETVFIDVDAFGKHGELIAKYFTKGRPILLEGRLRMDQWETQSGEKRSKLGVVLEGFQFVGPRGEDDASQESSNTTTSGRPVSELVEDLSQEKVKKSKRPDVDARIDEDVPF